MNRAKPRGRRYTERDRPIAQAMLARGDRIEDVAAYFGANQGRFKRDGSFEAYDDVPSELRRKLPPPGPYEVNAQYQQLYQLLVEIDQVWNSGDLRRAKGLLEDCVRYGVHANELRDHMDDVLDAVVRGPDGISLIR